MSFLLAMRVNDALWEKVGQVHQHQSGNCRRFWRKSQYLSSPFSHTWVHSEKEKKIIKETLVKLGTERESIDNIITKAEAIEENSNQILEYTKEAKNLKHESKLILVEALWDIIYSDENADMYEENLMRRLSGLLYLDKKTVGDIKEKIKNKKL